MSALDSLIRLNRWQLDERRRQLGELDTLAEKLRQELARLVDEQKQEQSVAAASLEAGSSFGVYARDVIDRRLRIEKSLASVEQEVAAAREALAETFREVKRYEIAAATRAAQQRKRVARREQTTLDEIGIENYRRRRGA
jgi:flagellar protein FliJ